jgi:hypothetical protein
MTGFLLPFVVSEFLKHPEVLKKFVSNHELIISNNQHI